VRVTALAGGIGGARFLGGLLAEVPDAEVTAIVNTGDDLSLHGLRICPDLDTVMYTLGGGISAERGWGREGETFAVRDELTAYGFGPAWFGLGDRDLATHLIRTQLLESGETLTTVTAALCERWQPGLQVLPMSDDRVETHVVVDNPDSGRREAIHFQEWWVRHHAALPAHAIVAVGAESSAPTAQVLAAIASADVIVFPPSNPVVSIGTILAVPGLREALLRAPAKIVGVSPIVGGRPVRGMADACLTAIGVETSAQAVAEYYGARQGGGLLDGWLVDSGDVCAVDGLAVRAMPLLMSDLAATRAIARGALELA
jgi:LPPG:FO 2-phospho-L-lactate transferase